MEQLESDPSVASPPMRAGATAPDAALVRRIVEAALLASNQPLSLAQLADLFPEDAPAPAESIERALHELMEANAERGVALVEVASGFRFQVHVELQPWISRLWTERPARYSRALLETLALIAYRQPITRGEIEQIRGVAVSSHIIKTLEEREWIRVVGHRDVPGRPALFGTTRSFLDYFSLRSLDQLPALTELQDLPNLEPELPFDAAIPAQVTDRFSDSPEAAARADALPVEAVPIAAIDEENPDDAPPRDADLASVATLSPTVAETDDTPEAPEHRAPEQNDHD